MDEKVTYVNGWLLPKGIRVEPQPVSVPSDARGIAEMINCDYVDVIYNRVASEDGDSTKICGYLDDEGLIKPHSIDDVNHLAMFLFDYTNPIIGDVIVVDSGAGGYDADLPEWLVDMCDDVVIGAAETYNVSMGVTLMLLQAVEDGIISADEMEEAIALDQPDEKFAQLAELAVRYAEVKEEGGLSIVDGFDKLLAEQEDN